MFALDGQSYGATAVYCTPSNNNCNRYCTCSYLYQVYQPIYFCAELSVPAPTETCQLSTCNNSSLVLELLKGRDGCDGVTCKDGLPEHPGALGREDWMELMDRKKTRERE